MYMKVQGRPKSLHERYGPTLAARNPMVAGSAPQRLEHHPEKNLNDLGQHLRVVGRPPSVRARRRTSGAGPHRMPGKQDKKVQVYHDFWNDQDASPNQRTSERQAGRQSAFSIVGDTRTA